VELSYDDFGNAYVHLGGGVIELDSAGQAAELVRVVRAVKKHFDCAEQAAARREVAAAMDAGERLALADRDGGPAESCVDSELWTCRTCHGTCIGGRPADDICEQCAALAPALAPAPAAGGEDAPCGGQPEAPAATGETAVQESTEVRLHVCGTPAAHLGEPLASEPVTCSVPEHWRPLLTRREQAAVDQARECEQAMTPPPPGLALPLAEAAERLAAVCAALPASAGPPGGGMEAALAEHAEVIADCRAALANFAASGTPGGFARPTPHELALSQGLRGLLALIDTAVPR
jgi:hypothetical protein